MVSCVELIYPNVKYYQLVLTALLPPPEKLELLMTGK